jgi:hypothetical protein
VETSPIDDPAALADGLALLMEGVYASAQASSAEGPAARARALAAALTDAPQIQQLDT